MPKAVSTFDVTSWDETPYAEPDGGPKMSRATVTKKFEGDLKGTSTAEVLLCLSDPSDYTAGAGYIGSEVIQGSIADRSGSFVVMHGGLSGSDGNRTFGTIIEGSGRGDLRGIMGTVTIRRTDEGNHFIDIDYTLP